MTTPVSSSLSTVKLLLSTLRLPGKSDWRTPRATPSTSTVVSKTAWLLSMLTVNVVPGFVIEFGTQLNALPASTQLQLLALLQAPPLAPIQSATIWPNAKLG